MLLAHQVLCGRFQVMSYLGEGGMGQVWEALDMELSERIAIKTIRSEIVDAPGVLARFKREVQATRRVTHPNVCRTFDLECHMGQDGPASATDNITFLTMELLRGETLEQRLSRTGPLPPEQSRLLAVQVAGALQAAHEAGIIHCDLKPANIFLTGAEDRLRAVVTDFGIARVMQPETSAATIGVSTTLTRGVMGTPLYMAPEQFVGRQCTTATDLYAFGLILHEVLTGEKASPLSRLQKELEASRSGTSGASTPNNIPVEPHWSAILSECLKTDPAERLANAGEVLDLLKMLPGAEISSGARGGTQRTLQRTSVVPLLPAEPAAAARRGFRLSQWAWIGSGAVVLALVAGIALAWYDRYVSSRSAAAIPSVAVLPLVSQGGGADLSSVAEGVGDDLTNELAQVSGLRVSSGSVVRSLGKLEDVEKASRQLGVDHVVTGSIAKGADGFHLRIELVDTRTEAQLWGQSYTSTQAQLTGIEGDIAQEVAFRLQMQAQAGHGAAQRHTVRPAAAADDQQGRNAMADRTPEGFEKAVTYFQQAIDADPQDAAAMAELAHCYALMAYNYNRPEPPLALLHQAEETARRALQLDSTSAEAYSSLADVEVLQDYNWTAAEKDYKRAVELDPKYIQGHLSYALHVLTPLGRFAEARAQYAYADAVPVKTIGVDVDEALTACFERRYQASIDQANRRLQQMPGNWVLIEILSIDYIEMGQAQKTLDLLTSTAATSADAKVVKDVMLGVAYARLGRKQEALKQAEEIERSGELTLPYAFATLWAAIGDQDKAMEYLNRSVANRETSVLFLGVDPLMDPLRSAPGFHDLMAKLNLQ